MNCFDSIRYWFNWAFGVLVDAALWCYSRADWPIVGGVLERLGDLFKDLSDFTAKVARYLFDASEWYDWLEEQIEDLGIWPAIKKLIRSWLPDLEDAVVWWANWWDWIKSKVDDWWDSVKLTVQGWIAIATKGLDDLIEAWDTFWKVTWPEWTGLFNDLKATWDNFWTVIFPTLVSFSLLTTWWNSRLKDIDLLFETWTKKLIPFWEGWQEIRDTVLEFFDDPLEWLWGKFADWFLGPEK